MSFKCIQHAAAFILLPLSDQVQERQTFSRERSLWLMARGQTSRQFWWARGTSWLISIVSSSVLQMRWRRWAELQLLLVCILLTLWVSFFAWYYLITSFKGARTRHSPLSIIHSIEGNHETSTPLQKIHPATGSLWEGDDGKLRLQAQLGGLTESLALALFPFKPVF